MVTHRALRLSALCLALIACDPPCLWDCDEEQAAEIPETQFACTFKVRSFSCESPSGSEWTPDCLTVKTKDACAEATRGVTQVVNSCEFKLEYQDVESEAGRCADENVAPMRETKATGEVCGVHEDCASGLCQPRYYCTVGCKTDAECAGEFSNGCCVGEGVLGYCLKQRECRGVCPEGAAPVGLPTQCTCGAGFRLATDGSQCVKDT